MNRSIGIQVCKAMNRAIIFPFSKPELCLGSATSMLSMFKGLQSFNQPLSFDTAMVTDLRGMFSGVKAFNQPLSLDTAKVQRVSIFVWSTTTMQTFLTQFIILDA